MMDSDIYINEAYLREHTDNADLSSVRALSICITPGRTRGLAELCTLLPSLVKLTLDGSGSGVRSLRDLGHSMNLRHLSVNSCDIHDFDGIEMFPQLQYMNASCNLGLTDITAVAFHGCLHTLDISECGLVDMSETLEFLASLPALRWLHMHGNPMITPSLDTYHTMVWNALPHLHRLDLTAFRHVRASRPCTARAIGPSTPARRRICPSTAATIKRHDTLSTSGSSGSGGDPFSTLTYGTGDVICGNLVAAMRRRRRLRKHNEGEDGTSTTSNTISITVTRDDTSVVHSKPKPPETHQRASVSPRRRRMLLARNRK